MVVVVDCAVVVECVMVVVNLGVVVEVVVEVVLVVEEVWVVLVMVGLGSWNWVVVDGRGEGLGWELKLNVVWSSSGMSREGSMGGLGVWDWVGGEVWVWGGIWVLGGGEVAKRFSISWSDLLSLSARSILSVIDCSKSILLAFYVK